MNVRQFAQELQQHAAEVEHLMRRKLPVIVGRMAKDHFQDNFRLGGFQNHGLLRWPVTRCQTSGIVFSRRYCAVLREMLCVTGKNIITVR